MGAAPSIHWHPGTHPSRAFPPAQAEFTVLYIPPGQYTLTDVLYIRRSRLVLRGAGRTKTTLYIPKSEPGTSTAAGQGTRRCESFHSLGRAWDLPRCTLQQMQTSRRAKLRACYVSLCAGLTDLFGPSKESGTGGYVNFGEAGSLRQRLKGTVHPQAALHGLLLPLQYPPRRPRCAAPAPPAWHSAAPSPRLRPSALPQARSAGLQPPHCRFPRAWCRRRFRLHHWPGWQDANPGKGAQRQTGQAHCPGGAPARHLNLRVIPYQPYPACSRISCFASSRFALPPFRATGFCPIFSQPGSWLVSELRI